MKLAILEILGLLAVIILPLFLSLKSKPKAYTNNNELSDYAINEDGDLVPLQYENTDW